MRNSLFSIFASLLIIFLAAGCKEKKEDKVIITSIPEEVEKKDTVRMDIQPSVVKEQWQGAEYSIEIECTPDSRLGIATDDDGNKYYDNRVRLRILRHDGSAFLEKTFVKEDFKNKVDEDFFKNKALVAFVFDKVSDDNLVFAASIGSPDKFSDDYVPFDVIVTPAGSVSIRLSDQNLVGSENNAAQ